MSVIKKILSTLKENDFLPYYLPLKNNHFLVITKKGRTYQNKYSIFTIKLSEGLDKITYESHIIPFNQYGEARNHIQKIASNLNLT